MIIQDQGLQQAILTRIDALTEKIGVTAEYLWPHLVKLELARGIGLLIATMVFTIVGTVLVMSALSFESDRNDKKWYETSCTKLIFGVVSSIIAVVFFCVFVVSGLPSLIAPEAAAFKNLLNL